MRTKIGIAVVSAFLALGVIATAHESADGLHGTMEKSMKDMQSMKMSGNVDQDFMTMMQMHHKSGIDMARVALKQASDPKVKELAQRVIDAQTKEISEIDAWLKAHPPKEASATHHRTTQ